MRPRGFPGSTGLLLPRLPQGLVSQPLQPWNSLDIRSKFILAPSTDLGLSLAPTFNPKVLASFRACSPRHTRDTAPLHNKITLLPTSFPCKHTICTWPWTTQRRAERPGKEPERKLRLHESSVRQASVCNQNVKNRERWAWTLDSDIAITQKTEANHLVWRSWAKLQWHGSDVGEFSPISVRWVETNEMRRKEVARTGLWGLHRPLWFQMCCLRFEQNGLEGTRTK